MKFVMKLTKQAVCHITYYKQEQLLKFYELKLWNIKKWTFRVCCNITVIKAKRP